MTLQMYLFSRSLIQLDDLVIGNFNHLKHHVHQNKNLRCVAAYLLACDVFEVELSEEELEDVKKLLKTIIQSR